jgi:hypothetical protein
MPFNKIICNSWDITFDEQRYNMAIWLFRENWFNGKNKEIILNELFENKKQTIWNAFIMKPMMKIYYYFI